MRCITTRKSSFAFFAPREIRRTQLAEGKNSTANINESTRAMLVLEITPFLASKFDFSLIGFSQINRFKSEG